MHLPSTRPDRGIVAQTRERNISWTKKLEGKVAIITGSDSGMGQAMAEEFARHGAHVAITWFQDEQGAQETKWADAFPEAAREQHVVWSGSGGNVDQDTSPHGL